MKRILFVDDESRILDGIRRMLYADRKRWDMEFAVGGEAALQACEKASFDVVISDMRMPGMDGATLLGHIRDRLPGAARIILSGHSEVETTNRAIPVAHLFLAKPCGASELQAAVERVCTLQELLNSEEIRRVVGTIGKLPSLPSTYASLIKAVGDPNSSMDTVAHIIEVDVAMSAKVLPKTVSRVQHAVNYLGMDTIKNLVLVAETFVAFQPNVRMPQLLLESLQNHANRVADIVTKLPIDPKTRDNTIVAALLHDVGKLVIASKMPDQFAAVQSLVLDRKCRAFEAEEEILTTSHAEIGAYLLGLWGIPHLTVEAIAHHHHPTRIPHSGFDSSVAIYVADLLAHALEHSPGDSADIEVDEADRSCLETLGIWEQFPEFVQCARQSAG